jgi:hypothetical protein
MPTIQHTGNLLIQLTPESQPAPVPVGFSMTYTEKVLYDFNFIAAQTVIPIPAGTVSNPRFVVVFVRTGTVRLSWNSDGTDFTEISANPSPPPTDVPLMLLFRYNAPASALYIVTPGAATGSVWLFE